MTLQEMADALRYQLMHCDCDLLARLPFDDGRVKCANFIEKHGDELEAMLGRRPVVEHAGYIPSGRGPFGRMKGGGRGRTKRLSVRWATR